MNKSRMFEILILVLVVVLTVAACQQTDAGTEGTATPTAVMETQSAPTATEAMEAQPTATEVTEIQPTATEAMETQPAPTPTEAMETQPTETPGATETPGQVEVVMRDIAFHPQTITVTVGTTVVWRNEDSFAHTVTSGTRDNPTDLFDSGNVSGGGGTFEFTFEEPGTYPYFCKIHPGMNGTIIVE